MLTYDDALNMNYYKKTSFTGWMGGMRFKIAKQMLRIETPDPDGALDEEGKPVINVTETPEFHAWVWPGPYIFDLTPPEKKSEAVFTFNEDGRKQAVDWVNAQYEARLEEWPLKKTDEV